MSHVLELPGFLDAAAVERVRDELRATAGRAAGLLGSSGQEAYASAARRATRVEASDDVRAAVSELLEGLRPRAAEHFGRPLDDCEEPQFLRYGPGDYFVAHQDGNTPLIHDDSRFRKVSVVLFLSDPATEFEGGLLRLHGIRDLAPAPGTLVAFPAETTHEVTPVTAGERLSVVSWYRGPA
jgi:SM-20-related protein